MKFLDDLEVFLRGKYEKYPSEPQLTAEPCPPDQNGDFTINCFKIARFCGNPAVAAGAAAAFLQEHPDVEHVVTVKAFVNITLKTAALYRLSAASPQALLDRGLLPPAQRRRILIEFSAPNTNKPQHLGHVRNNTLGMALGALLKRVGHQVTEVNLVNDRGIHICKSMLCYRRTGNGATPDSTGIKGDHLVGDFYVKYNKMLSDEIAALKAADPSLTDKDSEELFLQTELGLETQKMLQDWESGNEEVRSLWKLMNSWVFDGFAQTYQRMGINFDHTYLESNTYLLGKDIIAAGLASGVFSKREDGAIICDLGKMGKKVVLRSDGTSVYITQDIGTTKLKHDDYSPDTMIWVVGDEQNLHFQMLFEIMKRLGFDWAKNLYHLSYGMVNLPNGRMKSREGTVVDADDLFDEMAKLAADACLERNGDAISPDELKKRSEIIGLGALKFMLLKFNAKTTITFDPAASLKFEGDTGPYVQYVVARIASIERKAAEKNITVDYNIDWGLLSSTYERDLAKILYFYPQTLFTAAERRDCAGLVEYLLNLSKAFNRFYRECPVLAAGNDELLTARLTLADAVKTVITDGLKTLTIGIPDAM